MLDPNVWKVERVQAKWTPEVGDTCTDRHGLTWKILGYEATHDRPYLIGIPASDGNNLDCLYVGRGALVGYGFCDAKCPPMYRVERLTPLSAAFIVESPTIEGIIIGVADLRVMLWQSEAMWLGVALANAKLQ